MLFHQTGGFFLNVGVQSPETFTLPELEPPLKYGTLSFYLKFFGRRRSTLTVLVCEEPRETLGNTLTSEWRHHQMSQMNCNGNNIQVIHAIHSGLYLHKKGSCMQSFSCRGKGLRVSSRKPRSVFYFSISQALKKPFISYLTSKIILMMIKLQPSKIFVRSNYTHCINHW